jgi:hypothetical protein
MSLALRLGSNGAFHKRPVTFRKEQIILGIARAGPGILAFGTAAQDNDVDMVVVCDDLLPRRIFGQHHRVAGTTSGVVTDRHKIGGGAQVEPALQSGLQTLSGLIREVCTDYFSRGLRTSGVWIRVRSTIKAHKLCVFNSTLLKGFCLPSLNSASTRRTNPSGTDIL